jgi:cytochrome b561
MRLRNDSEHWGWLAMGQHWVMALLIFTLFALGWVAVGLPLSPLKLKLFHWHKSLGLLALLLLVLRVLWRLLDPAPRPVAGLAAWERYLARSGHLLLYLLMLLMPLSGWLINSAANFPFRPFGLFPLPDLVQPDKALQADLQRLHLSGFWLLAGLLVLHVAAALRHHFVKRNAVLLRMLPGRVGASGG